MMALGALIGDDDTFLESEGFLEFPDGFVHVLLAEIQVGHDLVVVHELFLRAVQGREDVVRLIHHFEPVI